MIPPDETVEQLAKLVDAGERIFEGAQNWRNGRSAILLHNAGLTVAAMNAYDNACRATYEPLLGFALGWSKEQRTEAVQRVYRFTRVHRIYRTLQSALPAIAAYNEELRSERFASIRRMLTPMKQQQAASKLQDVGARYLILTTDLRYTKGSWQPTLPPVWLWRGGSFINEVVQHANKMLKPLNEQGLPLLDEAWNAYGLIQYKVLRRHPSLVEWKRLMVDLSSARAQ